MKKISIAIPTYNREKYLNDCLVSIFNQTEKDIEILVFDNNSNYNIENSINKIDTEKKVKIIKSDKNLGNLGNFQRIKNYPFDSEYLIVFHDDDTMSPCYLKSALDFLEKNRDVVWLGSNINFVKKKEKMSDFKKTNICNFEKVKTNKLDIMLLDGFNLGFSSIIYKTKIFNNSPELQTLFNKFNKWWDRPFIIEMSKQGEIAITSSKLINYRIHTGQDSQDNHPYEIPKEMYNLLEFYSAELEKVGFKKPNKYMTDQSIIVATNFAKNIKQLINLLDGLKDKKWFDYKKISFRGFYYLIKFVIKTIQ